jgi:hypothetical protein
MTLLARFVPQLQGDRRNQSTIVGFFLVHAAAIGIETFWIGVCTVPRPFSCGYASGSQTL